MERKNYLIPYVIEKTDQGERSFDIWSRLLQDRIVMIEGEICSENMNVAVAELLFLNSQDKTRPIFLYINSPGGSVYDGQQLIDTMNFITAPVYTIALGEAMSMGAAILSAGEPGHRYAMPSSQILVHPMSGGTGANRTRDNVIAINAERKTECYLQAIIAKNCGWMTEKQKNEIISVVSEANIKNPNMNIIFSKETEKALEKFREVYDYDHFMFPQEALKFGIIDKILTKEDELTEE